METVSPLLPRALSFKDHQVLGDPCAAKPAAEVATAVVGGSGGPTIAPLVANISKQALRKRVERLMKPRHDGSYAVPEELVSEWKTAANQELILKEFQASGLDKDHENLEGWEWDNGLKKSIRYELTFIIIIVYLFKIV